MSKVTILHLSDLHIDSESDNLAKKLIKDVELLQDNYHHLQGNSGAPKIEKIDVIAVTGDIANKPSTNNYNAAIKFLNTLSEKLKTEKSNIVLVPGNHDVSWESRDFTGRFSHYGDFIRNFYDSENKLLLNTAAERHDSLYPLTINEQKILFIGLNSAVNVSKNKPNKGGELKVADLQKIKEDVNKKYKEYTRRIALFHHSCFRQKDDHDAIENWSSIKKDIEDLGIEMILHGHLHRGDMEQWITLKEERKFLITSTGSCKTGGLKESNADLYQYQIIVLDGNEKVYLYRRRFDRKDISNKWDGEWVADSDKEGRWCYSITPGTPGKQWEIDAPPYDIKKFLFGNTIPQNIMLSYHCSQSSPEEEPTFATLINLLSKHNVTFTTHQAPGKEPGEGFDFSKDEKIDQNIKEYLKHSHIFCIDSGGYNCYTQAMLQMVLKQRMKNIGVSFAWLPGMKEKAHNLNKQVEFQQVLIDGIYGYSAYEDGTKKDIGVIVRCPHPEREKGDGIIFIAGGIHKPATIAAIEIINDSYKLNDLLSKVGKNISNIEYFEIVFDITTHEEKTNLDEIQVLHFRSLDESFTGSLNSEMSWNTFSSLVKMRDFLTEKKSDKNIISEKISQLQLQSVHMDLTSKCPYHCSHCIEGDLKKKEAEFKFDDILTILYELKEFGVKDIRLYGGEPMAHPDFHKVLIAAAGMGFHLRLVSNGYYLHDQQKFDAIVKVADYIDCRFSIDAANEKTYSEIHGIRKGIDDGTCEENKATLGFITNRFKELANQNVYCEYSFLVGEKNYNQLKNAFEKATEIGARVFHIRPMTDKSATEISLNTEQRTSIKAQIKEMKNHDKIKIICPEWFVDYLETDILKQEKPQDLLCYSSLYRVVISPIDEGKIILCAYRRSDPKFQIDLDLKSGGLRQFLTNPERLKCCGKLYFEKGIKPAEDCKNIMCNRYDDNINVYKALRG